ncbi:MAG: SDR family NAD(P)-dependent oxidoreductase [Leptospiraceae bacterium]|nr:SDR family NAD(P)-dependent oxidoreductase [Leptospiraceae bacterium]MDW8306514.1 SDR family NAD(P)-dependent oxidoreductase [Leptospiraceae bacterium]
MAKGRHVICITGASSGIGESTARLFALRSWSVVGIARQEEKLTKVISGLPGEGHLALACDLAKPEAEFLLRDFFKKHELKLDVLLNNAGINHIGELGQIDLRKAEQVFAVNVLGVVAATQAALGFLQKKGQIVMVSSLAAVWGIPNRGIYSASKAALEKLAEAWELELRERRIKVSILRLAGVATDFHNREPSDGQAERSNISVKSPQEIAEIIWQVVHKRQREVAPGFANKIFQFGAHFLPLIFREGLYWRYQKEKARLRERGDI